MNRKVILKIIWKKQDYVKITVNKSFWRTTTWKFETPLKEKKLEKELIVLRLLKELDILQNPNR